MFRLFYADALAIGRLWRWRRCNATHDGARAAAYRRTHGGARSTADWKRREASDPGTKGRAAHGTRGNVPSGVTRGRFHIRHAGRGRGLHRRGLDIRPIGAVSYGGRGLRRIALRQRRARHQRQSRGAQK
jgi:hypothetical protein